MVSTVRLGSRFLALGASQVTPLVKILTEEMGGRAMDLYQALEHGGEDSTVVVITRPGLAFAKQEDVKAAVLLDQRTDQVFSALIQNKGINLIEDSRLASGHLIMRVVGNEDKIIGKVQENYGARRLSLMECIDQGRSEQTIISFSSKPLRRSVPLKDLLPDCLLIDRSFNEVYREIRTFALRYLSEGLENTEWHDIQIRIYDTFGAYDLQYERLMLLIESLELGMVFGESWTRDYARVLLSVVVYQIRLLTFLDPLEIKKILLGLEYLEDGTRVVDYDLYYKNKKITWPEAVKKPLKNKKEASAIYRKRFLERLNPEEKERLTVLEANILQTRK